MTWKSQIPELKFSTQLSHHYISSRTSVFTEVVNKIGLGISGVFLTKFGPTQCPIPLKSSFCLNNSLEHLEYQRLNKIFSNLRDNLG